MVTEHGWLISQPPELLSHYKPATSTLLSKETSTSHQPTEQPPQEDTTDNNGYKTQPKPLTAHAKLGQETFIDRSGHIPDSTITHHIKIVVFK
jgi:hypothetical protein